MRVLYVAMRHDYGKPHQGDSFEHVNFHDTLVRMASQVIYFDFPTIEREIGRAAMNRRLVEIARREKPDLMFTVLVGDEITRRTIDAVRATGTITLNWFCDDHWRFEGFSRKYAPCFDHIVTTAHSAVAHYHAIGITSVIESQWACNPRRYPKLNMEPVCDVSFVGMAHGRRRELVEKLRAGGVNVLAFGTGWESGRINHQQMIRLFNQSRINLNFAEASGSGTASPIAAAVDRYIRQPMLNTPGLWRFAPPAPQHGVKPRQIKARVFEVPACGGFLLTEQAENLSDYLRPGHEVATFRNHDELIERIDYFLRRDDYRREIAEAGHRRVMSEHTYDHRLADVFTKIGLCDDAVEKRRAA